MPPKAATPKGRAKKGTAVAKGKSPAGKTLKKTARRSSGAAVQRMYSYSKGICFRKRKS